MRCTPFLSDLTATVADHRLPAVGECSVLTRLPSSANETWTIRLPITDARNARETQPPGPESRAVPRAGAAFDGAAATSGTGGAGCPGRGAGVCGRCARGRPRGLSERLARGPVVVVEKAC